MRDHQQGSVDEIKQPEASTVEYKRDIVGEVQEGIVP